VEKSEETFDNMEDPGVDRRIILKRMFKKWNRGMD
jgi:hypothetical protein